LFSLNLSYKECELTIGDIRLVAADSAQNPLVRPTPITDLSGKNGLRRILILTPPDGSRLNFVF
jgi:hypothetical protein